MSADTVTPSQRFTTRNPCPVCGGGHDMPSGRGVRCYGFLGSDGSFAHCSREDFAGSLEIELDSGTFAHRLVGPCACGATHGSAPVSPNGSEPHQSTPPRRHHDFREAGAAHAYDYPDETGTVLFQVWRFAKPDGGKSFVQARPVAGGWVMGIEGVRRVLYRLPQLLSANPHEPVLVCEGEKDADRLALLGFVTTTAPMGAGKWRREYSEALRGRPVVIPLDNDADGERHGRVVTEALAGIAKEIRLLRLPDLPPKGDPSDWLDAGGTLDELQRLIAEAPVWKAANDKPAAFGSNGHEPSNPNGHAVAFGATTGEERPWPVLDSAAYHGLAGDVVNAIAPHTEGDPFAILTNFTTMFGSDVGRSPHVRVGATRHHANEFVVQVGETARARKGTAYHEVLRLFAAADPNWLPRVMGGLSSGEGLIHAVRDATYKTNKDGAQVVDDAGSDDKRLLAVESEFASVLRVASRDGNTLSEQLRRAWDGDTLRTLTRNSPLCATNPHICLLGHITKPELLRELTETSQLNGWANRHLFACVRRSQLLPHGGALPESEVSALANRLRAVVQTARARGELRRDAEADRVWEAVYPALTVERPGMLGAVTARAEAHVLRYSLIYALLDDAPSIARVHLEAALAIWQYAEDSATYIFGDATGDPMADAILRALRTNGRLTQTQISELFGKNQRAGKIQQALASLLDAGKVRTWQESAAAGRPVTYWEAV